MTTLLVRQLFLVAVVLTTHAAAYAVDGFGKPLQCAPGKQVTLKIAPAGTQADADWAVEAARRVGYPAALPKSAEARASALRTSALLRSGHIVAAKMANDQASSMAGYSDFGQGIESLMTVLTQPVSHASYPTSVRADGESREKSDHGDHTFGVDMEASSASLRKVIVRAQVAKRAMGDDYAKPAVRYYLLAQGFRDDIALAVASSQVCALRLPEAVVSKLDTSARFMAMPDDVPETPKAPQ